MGSGGVVAGAADRPHLGRGARPPGRGRGDRRGSRHEHILRKPGDAGVALDERGERSRPHLGQFVGRELTILEPEPVAVAGAAELVGQDGREERADGGPGRAVLAQPAREHVDRVDRPVERFEVRPERRVVRDLGERGDPRQPEVGAGGVVVRKPQISAALDGHGREVHPAGTGGAEQEVPQLVDDAAVPLLRRLGRQPAQVGIDPVRHHRCRVEERVAQRQ